MNWTWNQVIGYAVAMLAIAYVVHLVRKANDD